MTAADLITSTAGFAAGTGQKHPYDCSEDEETYAYFAVEKLSSTKLEILDFGETSAYSDCTVKYSGKPLDADQADAISETNFPGTIRTLGSLSSPVNYGTSSYPLELKNDDTDSFGTSVTLDNAISDKYNISDYKMAWDSSTKILSTWDDRSF